jgi:hypothetical protein
MGLVCCNRMAAVVLLFSVTTAHAEVASIYGGRTGCVATGPRVEND